jgi:hypothetical protein
LSVVALPVAHSTYRTLSATHRISHRNDLSGIVVGSLSKNSWEVQEGMKSPLEGMISKVCGR